MNYCSLKPAQTIAVLLASMQSVIYVSAVRNDVDCLLNPLKKSMNLTFWPISTYDNFSSVGFWVARRRSRTYPVLKFDLLWLFQFSAGPVF